jgi:5-methylcytosine-specific restriction endonuclease McrA
MIKNINVCGIHGKKLGMMFKKECIENDTHDIEAEAGRGGSLKKVSTKSGELKRASCEKWDLPEHCFTYAYQFCEISKLYLNVEDASVEHRSLIVKELSTKISGYKRQDVEKKIFQKDLFVSLENVIDKLLCSKLKCFYCKQSCEVLYKNMYSKQQWTLDRIDNDAGHNADNVVVSCLECNLKRGTMDSERFKYGKQIGLTFRKMD